MITKRSENIFETSNVNMSLEICPIARLIFIFTRVFNFFIKSVAICLTIFHVQNFAPEFKFKFNPLGSNQVLAVAHFKNKQIKFLGDLRNAAAI